MGFLEKFKKKKKSFISYTIWEDGHTLKPDSSKVKFFKLINPTAAIQTFKWVRRRQGWFLKNLTFKRLFNIFWVGIHFLTKRESLKAWPVAVKIDVTPLCNLKCTVCIHSHPGDNIDLKKQNFHSSQKMGLDQFRRIIEEIKDTTCAVALYYLGDPFMHPNIDAMCRIARDAGLGVHLSSNFSFSFSDERIKQITTSGVTHLTVCVDGLSQEKYSRTRVGGRIDWVLSNLRRLCQYRDLLGLDYPIVEVQYIKYRHNIDELDEARRLFEELGVDQMTDFWGSLHNYTDWNLNKYTVYGPRKNKLIAQCLWPYFSTVILYNGDVVPCCGHRLGTICTGADDAYMFGNVFKSSFREIWNSEKYIQTRELVCNPENYKHDASLKDTYCYGCSLIFDTNIYDNQYYGEDTDFEEVFMIGEKGYPVPRKKATSHKDEGD